jgi:hypothetical protein
MTAASGTRRSKRSCSALERIESECGPHHAAMIDARGPWQERSRMNPTIVCCILQSRDDGTQIAPKEEHE